VSEASVTVSMSNVSVVEAQASAEGRSVAIVAARFNDFIVTSLVKGAIETWHELGGAPEQLLVARVPGAFELPVVARKLGASHRYDALVALGCVIRGDTPHFDYVAGECARGLQLASLETGVPIAFGVLTVNTAEQALERAATTGANKGAEAMRTALEMAGLLARLG
jgi:6,7-dimethyl-8-ribityllumazine synthase